MESPSLTEIGALLGGAGAFLAALVAVARLVRAVAEDRRVDLSLQLIPSRATPSTIPVTVSIANRSNRAIQLLSIIVREPADSVVYHDPSPGLILSAQLERILAATREVGFEDDWPGSYGRVEPNSERHFILVLGLRIGSSPADRGVAVEMAVSYQPIPRSITRGKRTRVVRVAI